MIEAGFAGNEDVLCLKFNGWRFQGFEDAKIALIEGIVTGLVEKRPALNKAAGAVKDVFQADRLAEGREESRRLGGHGLHGHPDAGPDRRHRRLPRSACWPIPASSPRKKTSATLSTKCKAVLKPGESKNVPEEVEAFRKAFDQLLKDAGVKQLIVLIDDLDRCLPDTAIETLEAIRLFVFTARTAFVVAADEAMIEYAVRKHFPDLPDTTGPRTMRATTSKSSSRFRSAFRRWARPRRASTSPCCWPVPRSARTIPTTRSSSPWRGNS